MHEVYAELGDKPLPNQKLYKAVSDKVGRSFEEFTERKPVGKSGAHHSPMTRTARFVQQTMKARGLLAKVPGERGLWELTTEGKNRLHRIRRGNVMIAFSTKLGIAVWSDSRDASAAFQEQITLILTSPPYALAKPRRYGNVPAAEYLDWLLSIIEPALKRLVDGGSIVINIGNDVFEAGMPSRTLIVERLTIALHDRLGLHKMDNVIWFKSSAAPGPVQWASLQRVQLNVGYENCLWFTNNPKRVRSNNQRVLMPHTERHLKLIAAGGEQSHGSYADGRYNRRPGKFSNPTEGRIPKNVLELGHRCASQLAYKRACAAIGLPAHGAPFPAELVRFFVKFLTEPGDRVLDLFGGSGTTGVVCEELQREWELHEIHAEYLGGAAQRFPADGRWINPMLNQLLGLESAGQYPLFGLSTEPGGFEA